MQHEDDTTRTITTCYNGECPVCSREVAHYRRLDRQDGLGLGWLDIAQGLGMLASYGIDADTAKRRLHVIDEHGTLLVGIDAFIRLWQSIPRYRWLAHVAGNPRIYPAARALYEHVIARGLYALTLWRERRSHSA